MGTVLGVIVGVVTGILAEMPGLFIDGILGSIFDLAASEKSTKEKSKTPLWLGVLCAFAGIIIFYFIILFLCKLFP